MNHNYLVSNTSISISFCWSIGKFIPAEASVVYAELLPGLFLEYKKDADFSSAHYSSFDSWYDKHLEESAQVEKAEELQTEIFGWMFVTEKEAEEQKEIEKILFSKPEWVIVESKIKEVINYAERRKSSTFVKPLATRRSGIRTAPMTFGFRLG